MSASSFIRGKMLNKDVSEQSNGETALMYFISEIKDNSVYLLDEPENSMSASMQLKLTKFLEESARFFNCQFIIATHSPFILGMNDATIYDLDTVPTKTKNWWELENMKIYYNFLKTIRLNLSNYDISQKIHKNFTIDCYHYQVGFPYIFLFVNH